jgi:hypothetical protein
MQRKKEREVKNEIKKNHIAMFSKLRLAGPIFEPFRGNSTINRVINCY